MKYIINVDVITQLEHFTSYCGSVYARILVKNDTQVVLQKVVKYKFTNCKDDNGVYPNISFRAVNEDGIDTDVIFRSPGDFEVQMIDKKTMLNVPHYDKSYGITAYHKNMLHYLCEQYAKIILTAKGYDISHSHE